LFFSFLFRITNAFSTYILVPAIAQTRTSWGRVGVPQGQYSRIENGHVEPAVSTLEKLSKVFEVSITEFFKSNDMDEDINLPLLEKIKLIDTLGEDEKNALFKMIDLAISNKRMKDNLQQLIAS
jgi:transcriptional regulator with XRE-family HTH domain